MILDTHCHLHGREYAADLAETVARARAAGVVAAVLVGVDVPDTRVALTAARVETSGFFRVVAGVHPNHAEQWDAGAEAALRDELLADPLVVAVGETGLDYHYDIPRDRQRQAFAGQLGLARETAKPVVIHCREAYDDTLAILGDWGFRPPDGGPVGVLHCYFGDVDQAFRAMEMGWMIGVGGSSTFKSATTLHEVIRQTPLDRIVLETDAPYMAPVPFRGKRNEPAHLVHVVGRIAELKGVPKSDVLSATEANSRRLYRLG